MCSLLLTKRGTEQSPMLNCQHRMMFYVGEPLNLNITLWYDITLDTQDEGHYPHTNHLSTKEREMQGHIACVYTV